MANQTPYQKYRELDHQCDLAAYAVVGGTRVLARTLDPEVAKNVLQMLGELDARRKALKEYEQSAEYRAAKGEDVSNG